MHPRNQTGRPGVWCRVPRLSSILTGLALAVVAAGAHYGALAASGGLRSAQAARIVGTLTGYVNLENPVWAEAKDPKAKAYTFREIVPTVPAQYRRLSPYLPKEVCVALLSPTTGAAGSPITVKVGGGRTTPVTLAAAPGTKLIFQNVDAFPHRLYGVGSKEFTVSETARGARREWTVPAAGIYEIRDELAPSLRMWVVSEPKLVSQTFPSVKGEYSFAVDAPGEYQVQAYFAGQKVGAAVPVVLAARDVALPPIVVGSAKKEGDKHE